MTVKVTTFLNAGPHRTLVLSVRLFAWLRALASVVGIELNKVVATDACGLLLATLERSDRRLADKEERDAVEAFMDLLGVGVLLGLRFEEIRP